MADDVLAELLSRIEPAGHDQAARAERRVRDVVPEDVARTLAPLAARLAGAAHSLAVSSQHKTVLVVAADRDGHDSCAAELVAVAEGRAAVCGAARAAGASVVVVDAGLRGPAPSGGVLSFRIGDGAGDFRRGAAMSLEQARSAVQTGFALVYSLADAGLDVLGLGALDAVSVESSIAVIDRVAAGDPPLRVLSEAGGFDAGVLAGAACAAASIRIPAIIDGITTAAAAILAAALADATRGYLVAAHAGQLQAHRDALSRLSLSPLFPQGVSRGDGAGAALAMPLIDSAAQVLRQIG